MTFCWNDKIQETTIWLAVRGSLDANGQCDEKLV